MAAAFQDQGGRSEWQTEADGASGREARCYAFDGRPHGMGAHPKESRTMTYVFLFCAVVGGTVLIAQFVMTLLGLGGAEWEDSTGWGDDAGHLEAAVHDPSGHDAHGHHGSSWLFAVISFRTLVAAAAFFGLIGLAAQSAGQPVGVQLLLAAAAGLSAMYGVHWLVRMMGRLGEDHTLRVQQALGQEGTVYVPIPPQGRSAGKVQVSVQRRLVEFEAVTAGDKPLATGTKVRVVGVQGNVLQVEPIGDVRAV
jgi:membrane protein implicated in regulation of membrane protease activity